MIVVLCPTRGRPDQAAEMVRSFRETVHLFATTLVLVVDRDDPQLDAYLKVPPQFTEAAGGMPLRPTDPPVVMILEPSETGNLTRATNTAARRVWDDDCIIGHVGDDHRFRTPGWDVAIEEALREPGVAYADDGYWHEALCTSWFVSSSIPRTLGYLALPTAQHYAIDDVWLQVGRELGRLRYLPDVFIEHPSPKLRVKGPSKRADREALDVWRRDRMAAEVASVERMIA